MLKKIEDNIVNRLYELKYVAETNLTPNIDLLFEKTQDLLVIIGQLKPELTNKSDQQISFL